MGLLSDPSLTPRYKLGRFLAKYCGKLCTLLYIVSLTWFVCLAHNNFNHGTYLSENALSPGLVYPEIKQDSSRFAQTLFEELERERAEHKISTPFAWIVAKMKQIGLETHVHNFTLHFPYNGGKEYYGKNVYGILRAPRIGSTEGIVFSTPYRPPTSVHADITASVPVLLAFAEFARKKNYWAKDLIFLVTEKEQLGMHAWLEAYYNGGIEDAKILNYGDLPARAGALQAALNFEIQNFDMNYIDVKIEGLNGQLPNLDMFNLVQRITAREGIASGYKNLPRKNRRSNQNAIKDNLQNMISMLLSQANGVPNGNHGLYHRYRVESLTLEGSKKGNSNRNSGTLPLLKTIEGISRSLNNLLERFHQSYFFYILVQNDRFVSIGDFIPCLIIMASPMFIKAFLLWSIIDDNGDDDDDHDDDDDDNDDAENKQTVTTTIKPSENDDSVGVITKTIVITTKPTRVLPYGAVLLYFSFCFSIGICAYLLPQNQYIRDYLNELEMTTPMAICLLLVGLTSISLLLPQVFQLPAGGLELLQIGALLLLGAALIVLGLLNFATGFFIAILCTPLTIWSNVEQSHILKRICLAVYAFLLNPLIVTYVIVFIMTLSNFSSLSLMSALSRALTATMEAITYALMDNIIYGNYLYTALTVVLFPIWTLLWSLTISRKPSSVDAVKKIKTN